MFKRKQLASKKKTRPAAQAILVQLRQKLSPLQNLNLRQNPVPHHIPPILQVVTEVVMELPPPPLQLQLHLQPVLQKVQLIQVD